jgi:hypothetical protein
MKVTRKVVRQHDEDVEQAEGRGGDGEEVDRGECADVIRQVDGRNYCRRDSHTGYVLASGRVAGMVVLGTSA